MLEEKKKSVIKWDLIFSEGSLNLHPNIEPE